ncbi:MAG: flippase-like domain-containing protein [Actinobacteria bacterium]|nr:flippase-like domain-containing protein [Actinomycetota bacterium]
MRTRAPRFGRASLLSLLIGLPLSAIFFWLAFRSADLDEVWSVLTAANPGFVGLAIGALAGVYTGQTVRWSMIARTRDVRTRRFGEMVISGVAVNNVLPGRIGDLLRARWLQVAARIPAGRSLATVFVDRAFDVFALVTFLSISLWFVSSAEWLLGLAVGGLVLLVALGSVLLAARSYASRRARERRAHRSFLRRIARDALEGLADAPRGLRAVALAGVSLGTWGLWALAAWFVAHAIGIGLSPVEVIFATAVINLGVAIPSSPGFIGTYQWLGVSALALFDIGTEQALAFAILMQAVWYVPTTIFGGLLLLSRALTSDRTSKRHTPAKEGAACSHKRSSRQTAADEGTHHP